MINSIKSLNILRKYQIQKVADFFWLTKRFLNSLRKKLLRKTMFWTNKKYLIVFRKKAIKNQQNGLGSKILS